jgi:type VI secretion system protein ImpG
VRDDLLLYYERELTFLRQMGAEFAEKYPKIAGRLILDPNEGRDPHVERMLEAFAFLAARVHLKIDDEFPEITEALLSVLYPHYLRPIPSMCTVEFDLDPAQGNLTTGLPIPKGSVLYSPPVNGVPCKYRTCYNTTLWPLRLVDVQWRTPDRFQPPLKSDAAAALRFEIRCFQDVTFDKLDLRSLRLHLNGEGAMVHTLYELLAGKCTQIVIRDPATGSRAKPVWLEPDHLRPVGFADDEGTLPYPMRSFLGYRLLQEYFAFPDKFFFFDLTGLEQLAQAGFKDRAEILFLVSRFERPERQQQLETGVSDKTVKLNCTPIVNLFPQTAEPILLSHTVFEYPIVPDVSRLDAMEIFSVDEVVSLDPASHDAVKFEPFYSYRHSGARDKKQTFWHGSRRPSNRRNSEAIEVYLSLVDMSGKPIRPNVDTVTVRLTCTNGDLPSRLPFGNEKGDLDLEGAAPIKRIVMLKKPSSTIRPPTGRNAQWRLISHLSLNYLSLVEDGRPALQHILRLYNFTDSAYIEKQIEGVAKLESERHFARVISEFGISFARGTRILLELDEEQFVGGGAYLFAAILERFLALYVSLNSFSQLVVRTVQRREVLEQWPPRAGHKILM